MPHPTIGTVETRSAPEAAAPTVEGRKLRGLIPYGVESRDLGGWTEIIEPNALRGACLDDLVATVDHAGLPLARHPGTLTLEDRNDGMAWSLDLPESRADVREAVERGDLRACSWRQIVGRDEWRGTVRHVHEIAELRDVSVVTAAAYGDAAPAEYRGSTPAPEPPIPRTQEPTVPETTTPPTGGLRIEDRAAHDPAATVEARVLAAMAGVPKGESRALTHSTAAPVEPLDLSTFVWDRLRDSAVVLASGVRVIPTDRKSIKFPTITGDITADFYDELDEIQASDPTLGEFEIEPRAIKALVRGSSEAFEDSDPDLLRLLQDHFNTILGLKLDRELLVGNAAKGFKGLANMTGTQTLAVGGALTNYDPIIKAVGLLAEAKVPPPYAVIAHPRVLTSLDLLKEAETFNQPLARPAGIPPIYSTSQIGVTAGSTPSTTVLVFAPAQIIVARRRDVTVEVDRSQEFTTDAVLVRGKLRAAPGTPHPEAIVKITGVAAPPIT